MDFTATGMLYSITRMYATWHMLPHIWGLQLLATLQQRVKSPSCQVSSGQSIDQQVLSQVDRGL